MEVMLQLLIVINMSKINLRVFLIFIFCIIIIPSGKLAIPNIGILLVLIFQVFLYFPKEGLVIELNFEFFMALITVISFVLVFTRKRYIIISSIIIQYFHLFYAFKINDLSYWYYTLPTITYLLLSFVLIIYLFKRPELIANNAIL